MGRFATFDGYMRDYESSVMKKYLYNMLKLEVTTRHRQVPFAATHVLRGRKKRTQFWKNLSGGEREAMIEQQKESRQALEESVRRKSEKS
jgi:hypothetical protein